jgi:hypothetical protein
MDPRNGAGDCLSLRLGSISSVSICVNAGILLRLPFYYNEADGENNQDHGQADLDDGRAKAEVQVRNPN